MTEIAKGKTTNSDENLLQLHCWLSSNLKQVTGLFADVGGLKSTGAVDLDWGDGC